MASVVTRKAKLECEWADGDYTFSLPIGKLLELQEKTGAGPHWVCSRLQTGAWFANDVIETIRLGLIGGGLDADKAKKLVRRYVEPPSSPLMASVPLAIAILDATLKGVPDELPKDRGETASSPDHLSPMDKSGSETSTA
jgi:hypothetical protein